MPRAFSYLRLSTDVQLKGDGLRRQLEASKKYAAEHGLDLVEAEPDGRHRLQRVYWPQRR